MLRHGVYMFINVETGQVADMIGRDLVGKLDIDSAAVATRLTTRSGGWPSNSRTQEVSSLHSSWRFDYGSTSYYYVTLHSGRLRHSDVVIRFATWGLACICRSSSSKTLHPSSPPTFRWHGTLGWRRRQTSMNPATSKHSPCPRPRVHALRTRRICWPHTPYRFEVALGEPGDEEQRRRVREPRSFPRF